MVIGETFAFIYSAGVFVVNFHLLRLLFGFEMLLVCPFVCICIFSTYIAVPFYFFCFCWQYHLGTFLNGATSIFVVIFFSCRYSLNNSLNSVFSFCINLNFYFRNSLEQRCAQVKRCANCCCCRTVNLKCFDKWKRSVLLVEFLRSTKERSSKWKHYYIWYE